MSPKLLTYLDRNQTIANSPLLKALFPTSIITNPGLGTVLPIYIDSAISM